ncbi:unnamed protein product [Prorocentrum cordatum]|uniref:Uncharacterized protein n=1 Tax=Prorocentrum cordatum TaxID=2364126 RepID=A0ABN9T3X4_9DINO|nr:unnamed protein product [Polarella glacialis]
MAAGDVSSTHFAGVHCGSWAPHLTFAAVDRRIVLGDMVDSQGNTLVDQRRRYFWVNSRALCATATVEDKMGELCRGPRASALHGAETWLVTADLMHKLRSWEFRFLRRAFWLRRKPGFELMDQGHAEVFDTGDQDRGAWPGHLRSAAGARTAARVQPVEAEVHSNAARLAAFGNGEDWQAIVRAEMSAFVTAHPGSFIEQKASALVWHYRQVLDEAASESSATQLVEAAGGCQGRPQSVEDQDRISYGHKVVEVSYRKVRKGPVMRQICEEKAVFGEPFLSVLVAGDDTSDPRRVDVRHRARGLPHHQGRAGADAREVPRGLARRPAEVPVAGGRALSGARGGTGRPPRTRPVARLGRAPRCLSMLVLVPRPSLLLLLLVSLPLPALGSRSSSSVPAAAAPALLLRRCQLPLAGAVLPGGERRRSGS